MSKKERVPYSKKDTLICIEAFFKFVNFEDLVKGSIKKSMKKYIFENVDDYKIRKKSSWDTKIDDIHWAFRYIIGLPPKGTPGGGKSVLNDVMRFIAKTEFINAKPDNFSEKWNKISVNKKEIPDPSDFNVKLDKKSVTLKNRLIRNQKLSKQYLDKNRVCEFCKKTETFIGLKGTMYFEVHHYVPYNYEIQKDYKLNLDNYYNLISLCAECHRKIHLSRDRALMITDLFNYKLNKDKKFKDILNGYDVFKVIADYEKTYNSNINYEFIKINELKIIDNKK
ncbi:hypothetical protein STIUS_v1c02010 [Spiroplasma sp. TIUS-1]|uniref:HNH endonuclease signature motif containing protein n=1 Tax=Spiroplasma sp. TIUS-1 TaxID=216963 RepID=UPI00139807E8|nr:HNH endonuclease [Spiroplasma sp. TIUS-1]QHX35756.1 hypothetical protein STIUS_v1c02010 [Spiroplasma sp. TIUS-1]